jgi:hypothetical protein
MKAHPLSLKALKKFPVACERSQIVAVIVV